MSSSSFCKAMTLTWPIGSVAGKSACAESVSLVDGMIESMGGNSANVDWMDGMGLIIGVIGLSGVIGNNNGLCDALSICGDPDGIMMGKDRGVVLFTGEVKTVVLIFDN